MPHHLPRTTATAYLQPLREGGSLPAVLDTGAGLFVAKFRGAGSGPRALIAELIEGLLGLAAGLPVPELAVVDVPPGLADDQPDPEVRDLVAASVGANVGLRYLDGAFNYDARAAGDLVGADLAADVVWLDAYLTNPDRTPRNPNLLVWDRRPWLIDHGSALYAHHAWDTVDDARTRTPFPAIRDHVLLRQAGDLEAADRRMAGALTPDTLAAAIAALPDDLLADPLARGPFATAADLRARYLGYLTRRIAAPRTFVAEAVRARQARIAETPRRLETRR